MNKSLIIDPIQVALSHTKRKNDARLLAKAKYKLPRWSISNPTFPSKFSHETLIRWSNKTKEKKTVDRWNPLSKIEDDPTLQ